MFNRQKVAILLAEFLGTAILAVSVYAVVSVIPISLFAGMAAGLVLGLAVLTIGAVSGAHINPAITLGFWSVGKIKTLTAIAYIIAQVLGGFAALYLIKYFAGQPVESIAGKFDVKAFTAEAIGAFVFGIRVSFRRSTKNMTAVS
jgi:glycerol uptake facilitator-like aquaporin